MHENTLKRLPLSVSVNWYCYRVLGENPLWCDCNLKWLVDWIKQDLRENGVAKCHGPSALERKILLTAPASMFQCAEGYNASHILQKCDACRRDPCNGKGLCESSGFDSFTCHCKPGFYGDRCQNEIDACFGSPCENEGTCSALRGRFECTCKSGFSGFMCEINNDDCIGHQCKNGASCIDLVQEYTCKCPYGFKGKMCEISLDLCTELKPCKNGAKCAFRDQTYTCTCPAGFTDKNCSTNTDDCKGNICQNGAHCIDGLGVYSCECSIGYSGKYCATKTQVIPSYMRSSVCQSSDCQNGGVCFQPHGSSEYVCQCPAGYDGKKCEKLQSVSFVKDSYVQSAGLNFSSYHNITLKFTTTEDKGILFYQGLNSHIAVELYYGRVRVSFSPDERLYKNLLLYSHTTVNDSRPHTLSVVVNGPEAKMYLDGARPLVLTSHGNAKYIQATTYLYIGGLPKDIGRRARPLFQIVKANSFKGCVHAAYINDKLFDFGNVNVLSNQVLPGCGEKEKTALKDPCASNICANGKCIANYDTMDYKCICNSAYAGPTCDQRKVTCTATTYRDHYIDPDTGCKSRGRVKLKRCVGDSSCTVKRTRKKTIKIQCENKRTYTKEIEIPRKCSRSKRRRL